MESDLISRQAAIRWVKTECNPYGKPTLEFESGKKVIEHLEQMSSVQPERTKGKWIHDGYDFPHGNDWIHCSICGKKGINVPADLTNFCPNCGADMRGEELDETD